MPRSPLPPLRCLADLDRLAAALTDHERSPRFHQGGDKVSLADMERLDRILNHPLHGIPVVHVAGSKGKGSVCLLAESLLRAQGIRVGTYLSPHVNSWDERFRVAGQPAAEGSILRWVDAVLEAAGPDTPPTFFETLTLAAFFGFREQRVDVVVVEVGIGGRLDATNIVEPASAVVTSLECEHAQVLGPRLSDIAREKAGILKHGCAAVRGPISSSSAREVIREQARARGASLWEWGKEIRVRRRAEGFRLWLPEHEFTLPAPAGGPFAVVNGALAVAAVVRAAQRAPLRWEPREPAIAEGLGAARLDARCERIHPNRPWFRDGGHTPRSLGGACRWVAEKYGPPVLVLGLQQDKRAAACLRAARPWIGTLIATPVPGDRSRRPEDLAQIGQELGLTTRTAKDLRDALDQANQLAGPQGSMLLAGSFWLVGAIDLAEFSNGDENWSSSITCS